ncbi:GreA/GreB family elongation factor [Bryobacter aggregatus]|uniref:GreA/GreB family elongation factor n=1 Tax=Bryobacter aggregatus TaxID=360054 RepID=UPI0004E0BFA2|nr:transcription elongation factor GreA [Bryobacter aggregatus]
MIDIKKKLQDEIAALEHEFRTELPKEILRARELGDLSENAEYHAAKERQGYVNARLGQLKMRLQTVSMADMTKIPKDRVGLGSEVVVFDVKKEEEVTYKIVTSEETDAPNGLVSTSSPIGKGLLNKQVGDEVKIPIPGGEKEFEILRLKTIHDLAELS